MENKDKKKVHSITGQKIYNPIFYSNGELDLDAFGSLAFVHGEDWALRIAVEQTDNPWPCGAVLIKGCERCAGYGQPGWIIPNIKHLQWEKCDCWSEDKEHWPYCIKCNYFTTANTSGICHKCLVSERTGEK